jgi:hypothetical protein
MWFAEMTGPRFALFLDFSPGSRWRAGLAPPSLKRSLLFKVNAAPIAVAEPGNVDFRIKINILWE